MKNSFLLISLRAKFLLALMLVSLGFFSAFSQKDILLYSTDFTDWDQLNYHPGYGEDTFTDSSMGTTVNGSTIFVGSGTGATGFSLAAKPAVMPSGNISTKKGYVFFGNSSGTMLTSKSLNFVSGGAVELIFYHDYSNHTSSSAGSSISARNFTLDYSGSTTGITTIVNSVPTGVSLTSNQPKVGSTAITDLNTVYSGSQFTTAKTAGFYTVTFILPSTMTGNQILNLVGGSCKDLYITSMKVYSGVGSVKYVAATNYGTCTQDSIGLTINAIKGAAAISKTIDVKAWNVTGPITMSITGTDAAKFSLPVTSVVNADALLGKSIAVNFTPSVMNGVSNAQLILSSVGAPDYCINLTGLTSSGSSPEITTSTATIPFYTGLISTSTQTVDISGVNLTGSVTLSLTGTNASQFSLSTTTVSLADALAGKGVDIIYQGAIGAVTQNANLVISSAGATSVTIPLVGRTYSLPPTLYALTKTVTPGGTGIITQDLAGSTFASGVTVKVTAVPESGYKFDHWSDNNSTVAARSILMTENKNITAVFVVGTPPTSVTAFKAYTPSTIANTSFTARWSTVTSATGYTVTVYDQTGAVVGTPKVVAGGSTASVSITGLTAGSLYTYKVVATGTGDISNIAGPIQTTGTAPVPACGSN